MFKLDGGAMFGIIPKPLWEKKIPSDAQNRIELALRLLLIKTKNKLILIDTGIGDYHNDQFVENFAITNSTGSLEQALSSLNISTSDITDVVLSHLHFDHVGGLVKNKNSECQFENATVHIMKEHYDYSLKPTIRDQGSFHSHLYRPLIESLIEKNKVHFYGKNDQFILKDENYQLNFKVSHGHTPNMSHPYDQNFIYLADIVPTSNHVHIPWVMGYDISPGLSTEDKKNILKFVTDNKLTVIYEHDAKFWGSKIEKNQKGKYGPVELKSSTDDLAYQIEFI